MEENKKENMGFEEALARLEVIVRSLESGSAPLDESLALYEEGVALARMCDKCLEDTERKIKTLQISEYGEIEERDFPEVKNN